MAFFKRKRSSTQLMTLSVNITPLMDVLTVLLFFMVKIFSAGPLNVSLPKDLNPPASKVKSPVKEMVVVSLSQSALIVEGKALLNLTNGKFKKNDLGRDGKNLPPLKKYLTDQLKRRNRFYSDDSEKRRATPLPPGKLMIQADKEISFKTLKHVFFTASLAGYSDYQFLVTNY